MAGRLVAGLLPAALTVGFGFLVADDQWSLGGGDKELLLVIPLGAWSLLYASAFFTLQRRRGAIGHAVLGGAVWATAGVLLGLVLLYLQSRLAPGRLP
jgi:hypothetical protein